MCVDFNIQLFDSIHKRPLQLRNMKRTSGKKSIEKSNKSDKSKSNSYSNFMNDTATHREVCLNCSKDLVGSERVLFVEEEVGRIFCSENCIAKFFSPEIKCLEKDYFKRRSNSDFSDRERKKLDHLRWITLEEPEEVWREKTLSGDFRYTLISEYKIDNKRLWCVCICLFLKGEPSFLYLSFPTKNSSMVNLYRKGEKIPFKINSSSGAKKKMMEQHHFPSDGLADAWTEEETIRATMGQSRGLDDIPSKDYGLYESCFQETLDEPDEVWCVTLKKNEFQLFHFIRCYPEEQPGFWYIVIARETNNEEEIEILDACPTRDQNLVEKFRSGKQKVGVPATNLISKNVH